MFALSHTKIDELQVEDRIHRLLNRMDKVCEFTIYDYTCEGGNPTNLALENELTLLKAELHTKEDARIAEKARKKSRKKLADICRKYLPMEIWNTNNLNK